MRDVWLVLVGVGAGWVLSVFTPAVTHWLAKKRRRRALALLVCPSLEQFMLSCQAAIDDEGSYPKGIRQPSVPTPISPKFPTELDWTSIDPILANRILSLPLATTRAEQELRYIAEEGGDEPENEVWFSASRKRCAKLLREASELSLRLRQMAKLPPVTDNPFDSIAG